MKPTMELRWSYNDHRTIKYVLQQAFIEDDLSRSVYLSMDKQNEVDENLGWYAGSSGFGWQYRPRKKLWIDIPVVLT